MNAKRNRTADAAAIVYRFLSFSSISILSSLESELEDIIVRHGIANLGSSVSLHREDPVGIIDFANCTVSSRVLEVGLDAI